MTVTIAAAVCGSIIGLLVIAIACVCVVCISRHLHIQVRWNRKSDAKQQQSGSNRIPMQQNAAYREIPHIRELTDSQTRIKTHEQGVQLNLAYEISMPSQAREGMETESIGEEYERMYATNCHGSFGPTVRGLEKCSDLAVPREYELPIQQRQTNAIPSQTREGMETDSTGEEYVRMYTANRHGSFGSSVKGLEKCTNLAVPREYELPIQRQTHAKDTEDPYEYIL